MGDMATNEKKICTILFNDDNVDDITNLSANICQHWWRNYKTL